MKLPNRNHQAFIKTARVKSARGAQERTVQAGDFRAAQGRPAQASASPQGIPAQASALPQGRPAQASASPQGRPAQASTLPQAAASRIPWLDALRVFAFVLVLIYHFYPANLTGGLIGVDLLFGLSGFLTTGLAIDAFAKHGHFDFQTFVVRRIRRLFPLLLLAVGITLPLLFFVLPDFRVDIARQSAAALSGVTNFYEIYNGGSYEAQFIRHLFVHTWTLGIEFRFYLLWGLILWALGKSRNLASYRTRIGLFSALGLVAGLMTLQIGSYAGVPVATLYFADWNRLAPFFAGSLAAAFSGMKTTGSWFQKRVARYPLAFLLPVTLLLPAFLLAGSFYFRYTENGLYRIFLPVTSLLLVPTFLYLRALPYAWKGREPRLVNLLADYSYGVYLFHWPLLVLLDTKASHGVAVLLALALSFLLTWFGRKVWEPLFTRRFAPKQPALRRNAEIFALVLLLGALGSALVLHHSAPEMVSLQKELWVQGLRQDADQARAMAEAAVQTETQADAAAQAAAEKAAAEKAAKDREEAIARVKTGGVTIIGDSITLGVRGFLLKNLPNATVDGKVSRFFHEGPELLAQQIKSGLLKEYVFITLGANMYPNYKEIVQQFLDLLPNGKRLLFMVPYDGSATEADDSTKYGQYLPEVEKNVPYVTVADWHAIAVAHPEMFEGNDGTHFGGNATGEALFLKMVQEALIRSAQKPAKGE